MKHGGRQSRLMAVYVVFTAFSFVVWELLPGVDCCDLVQLSGADRGLVQSVQARVQQAQVVFHGLTTNIYRTITEEADASWDKPNHIGHENPNFNNMKSTFNQRVEEFTSSWSQHQSREYHQRDNGDNHLRSGTFTAYFELINTYKGDTTLALWDSNRYGGSRRRVNVTFSTIASNNCHPSTLETVPQEYIVFCQLETSKSTDQIDGANNRSGKITNGETFSNLRAISIVHWSAESEQRVWTVLGWGTWSDWSACSVSCGNGIQQRSRLCHINYSCPGPNIEQRLCNMFSCSLAVNPLALEDRRFFHPSRSQWTRVPDRLDAWRLQPNAYIWVPVSQVFPLTPSSSTGVFPKEFTVFVTLRVHNDTTMGTIWSLRSRRQQDAYLSLELAGGNLGVNLVHANGANGTDVVRIPANLGDGMWHYLALGIKDDSTVNTYVDCEWLRMDILKKEALTTPEDADLIIGYLFSGDLEQLVIVSNANAVNEQCSPKRTPIADPSLESRMLVIRKPKEKKTLISFTNNTNNLNNSHTRDYSSHNSTNSENESIHTTLPLPTVQETTTESQNSMLVHSNIVAKKNPHEDDDLVVKTGGRKRFRKVKKGHHGQQTHHHQHQHRQHQEHGEIQHHHSHHKKNRKKVRKVDVPTADIE